MTGCFPATLDQGAVQGVTFAPSSAIVAPMVSGSLGGDEDNYLTVLVSDDPAMCDRMKNNEPIPESYGVLQFFFGKRDGSFESEPVDEGEYDADPGALLGQSRFVQVTFVARESCDEGNVSATSVGGSAELTSVTLGEHAAATFDIEVASSGDDEPETLSGSFNAGFCDFDPENVNEEDACDS
jgi:hypothetical protein